MAHSNNKAIRMGTHALILSERGAHAFFQTVNITVVLMIAGDRVIQRVPRGLTWVTKSSLTSPTKLGTPP